MLVISFTMSTAIVLLFFFFNDTATTEIYTLSLHDALPISSGDDDVACGRRRPGGRGDVRVACRGRVPGPAGAGVRRVLGAAAAGASVGVLGGTIGLGGADVRLPLLSGVFGFAALQAVVLNKAMSLVVVLTA